MAFVPLHNHSDYSLLDGASQISKIVDRACDLGMESIALTAVSYTHLTLPTRLPV